MGQSVTDTINLVPDGRQDNLHVFKLKYVATATVRMGYAIHTVVTKTIAAATPVEYTATFLTL